MNVKNICTETDNNIIKININYMIKNIMSGNIKY